MPSYIVTVVASAGLTFLIQATAAQEQMISQIIVGAVAQVSVIEKSVPIGNPPTESVLSYFQSAATFTPIDGEPSGDRTRMIAQTVGGVAVVTFLVFILLAALNVINFAIWLPALPALIGLIAMAGAHFVRLERHY